MPEISIVIPVYQEASNITPFLDRTEKVLDRIGQSYEIIFALDPSSDATEDIILQEIERNPSIRLIVFSRRFGQPAATIAGILSSKGQCCVVIDVDLQDPPELIERLYMKMHEGYEVVYAKRRSRQGETFVKKMVTYLGYSAINYLSEVPIPRNTGDFRIMTRRVIEELRQLHEVNGFLRGLVAYVGFKQTYVEYDRDPRFKGRGHYNRLFGSLKIGLNGLICFSSRPLQLMSVCGCVLASFSFLLGSWYVLQHLMGVNLTPGLPTIVLVVTFFSGIQLLALGIVGEYIGRIYDEVKRRPQYIIDKKVNFLEA